MLFLLLSSLSLLTTAVSTETTVATSLEGANPYVSGCLYHHNLTRHRRVCNSDDTPDTVAAGLCRQPPFAQYSDPEVRLLLQDWESSIFGSWIIQIILGELLDVPTSAETGSSDWKLNFYNPNNNAFGVGFGWPNYRAALINAHYWSDCAKTEDICAHFVPEVWGARKADVTILVQNGTVEAPQGLGSLGRDNPYVPKFTAEQDPTLLSYFGLMGEENRRKLVARFKRPTTWKDYCKQVSEDNCTTPDAVAKRAPENEDENARMFVEGQYTGHFRRTEKNDCELNPTTCTGHVGDYPCTWRSAVVSQVHYLNIALDGDGEENNNMNSYSVSQLEEMWRAANATRSDIMMQWYTPTLLYGEFVGSDFEFTKVGMPTSTQKCLDHRQTPEDRCSDDPQKRIGDPRGICEEPPNSLHSLMVSTLYHSIHGSSIPVAVQSPAYATLKRFRITELQLEEIFALVRQRDDARRGVCDWAADNIDYLRSFIPISYPRRVEEQEVNNSIMYASAIVGSIVVVCVMATSALLYRQRNCCLLRNLQLHFLWMSLAGLLFVAAGAVVMAPPQSDGTCIAQIWLINLGYTVLLTPLVVKIGAINSVRRAAVSFRRKKISRTSLLRNCAVIMSVVVIFLILWTCIDAPKIKPGYEMVDYENGVIAVSAVCSSRSSAWIIVSVGWVALLLFVTSILAFQMQKIELEEFCETPTLSLLVYSHLFFILCRLTTIFLNSNVNGYVLARAQSLILSADTLASLVIYFVPKIMMSFRWKNRRKSALDRVRSSFADFSMGLTNSYILKQEHDEIVFKLREEIRHLKENIKDDSTHGARVSKENSLPEQFRNKNNNNLKDDDMRMSNGHLSRMKNSSSSPSNPLSSISSLHSTSSFQVAPVG